MKEVVVFGGGTGMSSVLKGLKNIPGINLSAIVTVADDGGSTALMRKEFNIPAIGDIRQILTSLSPNEDLLKQLIQYRFSNIAVKRSVFNNQSLGNIIISALIKINGDFYKGIETLSEILNIKGSIHPITDYPHARLQAVYSDGTKKAGEHRIPNPHKRIETIRYVNPSRIKTNPQVLKKIAKADFILISTGSLYTSIIPNLIAPGVKEAIAKNRRARVIYVANIMTQSGETHDMTLYDHVAAIEKHLQKNAIQTIVTTVEKISPAILRLYEKENCHPVLVDVNNSYLRPKLRLARIIDRKQTKYARHDPRKLQRVFAEIFSGRR